MDAVRRARHPTTIPFAEAAPDITAASRCSTTRRNGRHDRGGVTGTPPHPGGRVPAAAVAHLAWTATGRVHGGRVRRTAYKKKVVKGSLCDRCRGFPRRNEAEKDLPQTEK
ncbi:hypothetical protein GCM10025331_57400 [Actinoplanes utahensis]